MTAEDENVEIFNILFVDVFNTVLCTAGLLAIIFVIYFLNRIPDDDYNGPLGHK